MNAMQKIAWWEVFVTTLALVFVGVLYPWLGSAATGGFGLLALIVGSVWFVRKRNGNVIVDERDREIERLATKHGVESAWMLMFISLAIIVLWSSAYNGGVVPTVWLTWLVWIQILVCYLVKGIVGVVEYRRHSNAA